MLAAFPSAEFCRADPVCFHEGSAIIGLAIVRTNYSSVDMPVQDPTEMANFGPGLFIDNV